MANTRIVLSLFAVGSMSLGPLSATGQVLLPDTNERAVLNQLIPGIVDVNGIMDTLHPNLVDVDTLDIYFTEFVPTLELVGIQYLHALACCTVRTGLIGEWGLNPCDLSIAGFPASLDRLNISLRRGSVSLAPLPESLEVLEAEGIEPVALTVAALPTNMKRISLRHTDPILWPTGCHTQQLGVIGADYGWSAPIPSILADTVYSSVMSNNQLPDFTSVTSPVMWITSAAFSGEVFWPSALHEIVMLFSNVNQDLDLPNTLHKLTLESVSMPCLPWLPDSLTTLELYDWSGCLPNWPSSLETAHLWTGDVTQATATYCSVLNSACPGSNPGISGHILMDLNQNGQCDQGEPPLAQASVTLSPNGNVTGCDANGYWEIGVLPGNYTITPSSTYPYFQSITPAEHTANLPNMGDADTLNDFAVTLIPDIEDLRAFLWAEPARPGFNNRLFLTCQNYGTVPMDVQLTLEYDADQTWVGSSTAPTTQSGTTATWQLGTLAIGASQQITVDLNTATTVALGTPIDHTLNASPSTGDETPPDNIVVISDIVVGSFDPNDKRVRPEALPPAIVQAGTTPIDYTIRFQNTGTYLAERVVIVDTLPEGLQPQSIEFLSSSHTCHWYVLDGVLHFIHEGINLPDSTSDEPGSHGYVQFRIKPDTDLADGAEVVNIAHIVFDFNEPIVTPPATFRVDVLASVEEQAKTGVQVHPNPVRDRLWITLPRNGRAQLSYVVQDLFGRKVMTGRTNSDVAIDVSSLPSGVFVLTANNNTGMFSTRFVKQ